MNNKIRARARARVTIEFLVEDVWGSDCPMDQIYKQARESALGRIRDGIKTDGIEAELLDVKVTAILVEEER